MMVKSILHNHDNGRVAKITKSTSLGCFSPCKYNYCDYVLQIIIVRVLIEGGIRDHRTFIQCWVNAGPPSTRRTSINPTLGECPGRPPGMTDLLQETAFERDHKYVLWQICHRTEISSYRLWVTAREFMGKTLVHWVMSSQRRKKDGFVDVGGAMALSYMSKDLEEVLLHYWYTSKNSAVQSQKGGNCILTSQVAVFAFRFCRADLAD